jgi:RHS repeat-associated protein
VGQFLSDTGSLIVNTRPHAFLNWILLDNQFNYVSAISGFLQVGSDTLLDQMVEPNLPMTSNGYLYIYTSNETPNIAVFFDNLQVTHVRGPLLEENHYYPFGLLMSGISDKAPKSMYPENKYRFGGKELQHQEFSDGSGLELYDYGARMYDQQLGRWDVLDKMADKYYGTGPYVYVLDRPTVAFDPDGKRVYFVGGANNDQDGWNYIQRWDNAFKAQGINDFVRVNESRGKIADIQFTADWRDAAYDPHALKYESDGGSFPGVLVEDRNTTIDNTVDYYKQQLKDNPLKEGEQFNLAGYSYGSVLQAQAALQLANSGQVIDNLILIGSPISDKSDLMKDLKDNKNIKNVVRYDIKGDLLSNPQDVYDFIKGGIQTQRQGDNAHHFDAARPGNQADQLIQTIITWLKQQGVKN